MKTALVLLLLISLVCDSVALTCLTCVAASEDECNEEASTTCPQGSDACATITGPSSVLKMCSDREYCNKGSAGSSTSKVDCCYSDNCNKPTIKNSGTSAVPPVSSPVMSTAYDSPIEPEVYSLVGPLVSSPALLIAALLLAVTFSQL